MVPTSEQFCLYIKIMKEGPTFPHLCTVSDKNSERPESTGRTGQTCSVFNSFRFCRRWDCALANSSEISLRVEYSVGGWDSAFVSQPAEWWEPGTRQPKMVCYFYHSLFNLRAALLRPVAGSSPKAAEFNPRTALPRCDGKHLASCLTTRLGRPASVLLTPLNTCIPRYSPVDTDDKQQPRPFKGM